MNHPGYAFLCCFLLFCVNHVAAVDIGEESEDSENIQLIDGQQILYLDEQSQRVSGIKTVKLGRVKFQIEYITYGRAIKLTSLLSVHNRYKAAIAQQTIEKAILLQSEKNLLRARTLHKHEAISSGRFQKDQSQWALDKARYEAGLNQTSAIVSEISLQWGETLAGWITDKNEIQFKKLLSGGITLLQVVLPADKLISAGSNVIFISLSGERDSAIEALLLSEVAVMNTFSQGRQYLFMTEARGIKRGVSFTAWIPEHNQKQVGIIVPEASLVWHLGQTFVFMKMDETHFVRRNIRSPVKVSGGYFIRQQISNGEEIVTSGVQMLLSHELKSQIPDEDDD